MRKNKIRRLMAAALTAAMVVSMGGMSAFAATTSGLYEGNDAVVPVTKNVVASPSGTIKAPSTSFTFSIAPADINDAQSSNIDSGVKIWGKKGSDTVYVGMSNGAFFGSNASSETTVTFDPDTNILRKSSADSDATNFKGVSFDVSAFPIPGIYRYIVTEKEPETKYDGMDYSKDQYYLDVYVENGTNSKEIKYVEINKVGETDLGKQEIEFNNTYHTNNVTITKKIEGNQANMSAKFEFNIKVTGQEGEKFATNYSSENGDTLVLTTGISQTIKLGNNESITIYGLSANDSYEVYEKNYTSDGYETTVQIVEGRSPEDRINGLGVTGKVNTAENAKGDIVIYTNKKTAVTPTGIALSFAPYALLVVLAGVFGVLFLRKRREDEI